MHNKLFHNKCQKWSYAEQPEIVYSVQGSSRVRIKYNKGPDRNFWKSHERYFMLKPPH